jgi:hypothetical protein
MSRVHAVLLFSLAMLAPDSPAVAAIGEVVETVALPAVPRDRFWTFCAQSGHFHMVQPGTNRIYVSDAAGNVLRQGQLVGSEISAVLNAGGVTSLAGGMAAVGQDETWILFDGANVVSTWNLVERVAGEGNWTLAPVGSASLQPLLSGSEVILRFAVDGSGDYWCLTYNPQFAGNDLLRISAIGPELIERHPLDSGSPSSIFNLLFGGNLRATFESLRPAAPPLAIDQTGGAHLFLVEAPLSSGATTLPFCYAVNLTGGAPQYYGRFESPGGKAPDWCGGQGVVYMRTTSDATVHGYAVEQVSLPDIGAISYDQAGVFWTGCHVDEQVYTVAIDWGAGAAVGFVHIGYGAPALNGEGNLAVTWTPATASAWGTSHDDLDLLVRLFNDADQVSPLLRVRPNIAVYNGPLMPAGPCALWSRVNVDGTARYLVQNVSPIPPLSHTLSLPNDLGPFPAGRYGIEGIQVMAASEFRSMGRGGVGLTGVGRITLGRNFIGLDLRGQALTEFVRHETDLVYADVSYPGARVHIEGQGGLVNNSSILSLFPVIQALESWRLIGSYIKAINSLAMLQTKFFLAFGGDLDFDADPLKKSNIRFSGLIFGGIRLDLLAHVRIPSSEFAAWGGAQTQTGIHFNPVYFDPVTLTVRIGARLVILQVVRSYERIETYRIIDGTAPTANASRPGISTRVHSEKDSGWQYLYGSHPLTLNKPKAKPFIVNRNPFKPSLEIAPAANAPPGNVETAVIGGLDLHSAPFTASAPNGAMMVVWTQEADGLPPTQAADIWYSYFDGAAFSDPAPISADTHLDSSPKVAWHKSGKWVALWERVNRPDLPTTGDPPADLEATLPELIPAASIFDPAARTWSAPQHLFSQGLCKMTTLATGPTHDVAAVWVHDPSAQLFPMPIPTTTSMSIQDRFHLARFDGNAFSVQTSVIGSNAIVEFDAKMFGDELRIASIHMCTFCGVNRDPLQGNLTVEVRSQTAPGLPFAAIGQHPPIVDPSVSFAPRLLVDNGGDWSITYHRQIPTQVVERKIDGTQTVHNLNAPAIVRASDPADLAQYDLFVNGFGNHDYFSDVNFNAEHLTHYSLAAGPAGEAFVVYDTITDDGKNLVIVYDDRAGSISMPGALLADPASESSVKLGVGPDGRLLIAYLKNGLNESVMTVDIDGTPTQVAVTEPETVGTLHFLTHEVLRDLMVGQVRLRGGRVDKGEPIRLAVDVSSRGDLSADDVAISIYARLVPSTQSAGFAPAIGDGFFLVADAVPVGDGFLPGHATETVEVEWVIPEYGQYEMFAVLDPLDAVDEAFEDNNQSESSYLLEVTGNAAGGWWMYP